MRLVVKRWGNGLAVRLPRQSPQLGRLEEGMELEADIKPLKPRTAWKPHTFRSGIPDLSQRVAEIAWGHLDDKYPRRRR